jgi:hypothetical protein
LLDFKVAKWAKYKLLNLHGTQLISTLAAFIFVPSVFGENIPTAELGIWNDIGRNCLLGQIFNEDCYLPLYLPLWGLVANSC